MKSLSPYSDSDNSISAFIMRFYSYKSRLWEYGYNGIPATTELQYNLRAANPTYLLKRTTITATSTCASLHPCPTAQSCRIRCSTSLTSLSLSFTDSLLLVSMTDHTHLHDSASTYFHNGPCLNLLTSGPDRKLLAVECVTKVILMRSKISARNLMSAAIANKANPMTKRRLVSFLHL